MIILFLNQINLITKIIFNITLILQFFNKLDKKLLCQFLITQIGIVFYRQINLKQKK